MGSPRNLEPFAPEFQGRRTCPRCGRTKDVTPENWTCRHVAVVRAVGPDPFDPDIVTMKVRAPTVYCRDCVNENKRNHRLTVKILASAPDPVTRAEWSATVKGPCAICGTSAKHRGTLARFDELIVVCSQCKALLIEAEHSPVGALTHARQQSAVMSRHCLDETRIVNETLRRTNLDRVPYHKYNPEAKYSTYSHLVCLSLELSWRKIRQWLETAQAMVEA